MNALIVLVATTALGIEVGWEPLPGGGHEYTLQLEPQLLKVLEGGEEEIFSEVPAGVDVRRYRIVVGVGKLRRDYGPLAAEIEQPPAAAPPAAATGSLPMSPAADPYSAQSAVPHGASTPATDLESIPPATEPAAAPDFGLPAAEGTEPEFPAAAERGASTQPATETNAPAADLWNSSAEQPTSQGKAEQIIVDPAAEAKMAQAPAKLPESKDPSAPIRPATFEDSKSPAAEGVVDTGKPALKDSELEPRPWPALVVAIVLLACSLGGNIFLGWIAADARARYRSAAAKIRGAAA